MAWFKEPDFKERQKAAAQTQKAAVEKFCAKAANPAAAERQQSRAAGDASDRAAAKQVRAAEKAERKARDAEAERQATCDAAIAAEGFSQKSQTGALQASRPRDGARRSLMPPRKARSKKSALSRAFSGYRKRTDSAGAAGVPRNTK